MVMVYLVKFKIVYREFLKDFEGRWVCLKIVNVLNICKFLMLDI